MNAAGSPEEEAAGVSLIMMSFAGSIVCAIVGGVFTVAGMVDALLYQTVREKKRA